MLDGAPYGLAVDWWALGIFMFELMTGHVPFDHEDDRVVYDLIRYGNAEFPPWLSSTTCSVLRELLHKEPRLRLGGGKRGGADVKAHEFFSGISWEGMLARRVQPPFVLVSDSVLDQRYRNIVLRTYTSNAGQ